jgi:hypothetical protein
VASVTVLDPESNEVEVSTAWQLVALVYGRGWRLQGVSFAAALDILAGDAPTYDENLIAVLLGDLRNPTSLAIQAIQEVVSGGGAHSHAEYIDEAELTAALATKADTSALAALAPLASPTFTGTVGGITKSMVGLGSVDNTADTAKPVSTAQQTALNLKANLASPTFTGTVGGITKAMVGLGNFDNTADSAKPVSTAQQTALNGKANTAHTHVYADVTDVLENIQDAVAAMIAAGTGITKTYNDTTGTLTIDATGGGGSTDPEIVRDTIGSALVQGAGITITLNDAGDTITIASTAVLPTRQVIAGNGLTGGGDLSTDRTFTVAYGSAANTAVQGNDARVTADQAAGTASIRTIGTGALQAAAGNHTHSGLTADQAAGTASVRTLGTGALQAAAGNHGHAATGITDSSSVGRSVLTAADAAAARTAIGAGTSSLALGTTNTTAKAGDYAPNAAAISDSTSVGRSILTAADAAAVRTASGAGRVDSSDASILNVVKLTQAAYDGLGSKVATTLYVIVG